MVNHYAVLGVRPGASADEIRAAHRRAAWDTHPDRAGDAARFQEVQAAYDALRDPAQRAAYDRARAAWMKRIGAVACAACGHANRITRAPNERETVRCWHCKTPLALAPADLRAAQRQALVQEAAALVDAVGSDLAELAADAVRAGIARVRLRLGLSARARRNSQGG